MRPEITDLSALSSLSQLTRLYLRNNPLSEEALEDQIPALEAQGVNVYLE